MIEEYLFKTACIQGHCIERGYLALFIIPIFFLLLFLLYKDFLKFQNQDEKKTFKRKNKWLRLFVLITRTLIISLILIALARPFTTEDKTTNGHPVIRLLVDSTDSMSMFNQDLLEKVKQNLGSKTPVEIRQISSGKRSELGEGILKNIEGNDNLLLITDGNNNFGKSLMDVAVYTGISDTRLFALDITTEKNDAYIQVLGPSETIEGTLNKFTVRVTYTGSEPAFNIHIYIDDKLEFSGDNKQLEKKEANTFEKEITKTLSKGYHKIEAKIMLKDYFEQNNVFYKTVKSVPKPKVLLISKHNSPLEEGLRSIYELSVYPGLPQSLKGYSAIIFNDIPASDINPKIEDLTGFLLDGNGIVFIGGRNSFDKGDYKGTMLESLLPVQIGSGKVVDPLNHNIVLIMDVSDSFSDHAFKKDGSNSALDLGKGMAVKMIEGFRDDINVGVVIFATTAAIKSEPVGLKDNRPMLIDMIKRLPTGDGTQINQGLLFARKALNTVKGTKNAILISDGKSGGVCGKGFLEDTASIRLAKAMGDEGIKIYTVGMPSVLDNQEGICKDLMIKIAAGGNGNYFEPSESQYLNVFFGKPEAKDKIFSGTSNLAVIDKEHFITQDLRLINPIVTGINFVVPKSGARSLIYTGDSNPVLNTWNFGIGRVVTLATDDGKEWAATLTTKDNSMLITRTINYAIGNPEKGKDIYLELKDGYMGETTEVKVRSDKYPVSNTLTFTKEGESIYKATFSPDKEGFYQFFDSAVAINAPREYYSLGLNPRLKDVVEISGGKMLKLDDKNMADQIESLTQRKETVRKDLMMYPLGIALIIFMIELVIRKIYEYKKYQVNIK